MIKTFKSAISLFLAVVFVLSLVPTVSFAADAYPWTGSNTPAFRGYRAVIQEDGTLTLGSQINSNQYLDFNMIIGHEGVFGKLPTDTVYKEIKGLSTTKDSVDKISFAAGGSDITANGTSTDKDYVIEFSICLENGSSVFSTDDGVQYWKDYAHSSKGTWTNFINIKANKLSFAGKGTTYEFVPGRWYNLTFVCDFENTSDGSSTTYNYQAYVNGEMVINGSTIKAYAFRTLRMGSLSYDGDIWLDNMSLYKIDDAASFVCPEVKSPVLSSNNADIVIDTSADSVVVQKNNTVSDLKAALSVDNSNTEIRYYNSDYSAQLADTDSAIGANIVIAGKRDFTVNGETVSVENTYTYYEANKWMYRFDGINDGSIPFDKGGSSKSFASVTSVNGGVGGKTTDDYYIRYADSAGEPYHNIVASGSDGDQDVLEMSVYVPSDCNGTSLALGIYGTTYDKDGKLNYSSLPILIKNDGLYTNFSGGPAKFHKWDANKWYNIAFVTPDPYIGAVDSDGKSLDSNVVKIYVNGVLIDNRGVTQSLSGFRHARLSSSLLSEDDFNMYFDNVRRHSGTYEPQYDALAEISYKDGIDANNNIIVKGQTTVGELKAGITKEDDTAIRVYSSLVSTTEMADTDYVTSGNVVVAAAMNNSEMERSYNYYTIDKLKREIEVKPLINGTEGKIYDKDDAIAVNTSYTNYDEAEHNVSMYTAVYKHGKLVKIYEDSQTVDPGKTGTFTCDFADLESKEGTNVKVMLWDSTTQTPYLASSAMRYNNENTKATLYLLGDSIVQTYDNPGYPIQGWGNYIGDYLNDNITVENRATSGWTTDHYLYPDGIYTREDGVSSAGMELLTTKGGKKTVGTSNRHKIWSNILSELKEGDYVMVSLGINDSGSGNVPVDRYLENITTIYNQASSKGATVIFSTPTISGREWDNAGGFAESWGGRGVICSDFAKSHNAVCIPLGSELVKIYNAMANDYLEANPTATKVDANNYVRNYFHMYPASGGTLPDGSNDFGELTSNDSTHHNYIASNKVAGIIARLLSESGSPLGDYVVLPE